MNWLDILLSFLLNGVVILILKSVVETHFSKEVTDLQHQNDKELARLNSQLQWLGTMESTRFAELHQRRAVALVDLYKLISIAEDHLSGSWFPMPRILSPDDHRTPFERARDNNKSRADAVEAVTDFYRQNKILFTTDQERLMDPIVEIFRKLQASVFSREYYREALTENEEDRDAIIERTENAVKTAYAAFNEAYPPLRKALEDDFRRTLGLDIDKSPLETGH